jgi:hypothetical protein
VTTLKKLALALGLCAVGTLAAQSAFAQSTDGYHTMQVFPVVVDTGSFAQRFTFKNPNAVAIHIVPRYLPGTATATATAFTCPTITVNANAIKTFASLRDMCPALALGSNFGFLSMYENDLALNLPFAAFSRVANPQGNGFSVEAFPAHTFTSADSVVAGVRRLAASGANPAFQTNCFVANMYEHGAQRGVTTSTYVTVRDSAGTQIGVTKDFPLAAGKLTRLSDIFASVDAPAGDYDNASVNFEEVGDDEPGLISFCTVQDNTSFGADFRIAKQEDGGATFAQFASVGSHDAHVSRNNSPSQDMPLSPAFGGVTAITRTFSIPASAGSGANTHVMYFRNPDWIFCEIINPATGERALPAYGLEMRMLAEDGLTLIAGGGDKQGFGPVYLGDKTIRNAGSNTRYAIEVEDAGGNDLARPYRLHCQSGSGHTGGDIVRYNEATDRF